MDNTSRYQRISRSHQNCSTGLVFTKVEKAKSWRTQAGMNRKAHPVRLARNGLRSMSNMTDSPGGGVLWLLLCSCTMPGCSAAMTSCRCCKQAANNSHFCVWLLQMHRCGVLSLMIWQAINGWCFARLHVVVCEKKHTCLHRCVLRGMPLTWFLREYISP